MPATTDALAPNLLKHLWQDLLQWDIGNMLRTVESQEVPTKQRTMRIRDLN